MTDSTHGINSIADQRYYHFVVVKGSGLTLSTYWRKLEEMGKVEQPRVQVPVESRRFTLEHRKLRYKEPYARGNTAKYLSDRNNSLPPFHYDLFAGRLDIERDTYFLFGYPFASLALDIVGSIKGNGFLRNTEFQRVHLVTWLGAKNRPFKEFEGLTSSVVGVRFVVMNDTSLTAVRLGGHDPFEAELYKDFIREKFEGRPAVRKEWVPDQCILACDRASESKADSSPAPTGRVLRSRLHIDKHGNFKFYMHTGCVNAALLPYAIGQIRAAGCLEKASDNPLKKIEQDESE